MAEDRYDLVVIGAARPGSSPPPSPRGWAPAWRWSSVSAPAATASTSGSRAERVLLRWRASPTRPRHADRFGLGAYVPSVNLARVMAHVRATIETVVRGGDTRDADRRGGGLLPGHGALRRPARRRRRGAAPACAPLPHLYRARPALPDVPGLADTPYLTSETVWALEAAARPTCSCSAAGPSGWSWRKRSAAWAPAVTLLTRGDRLLGRADPTSPRRWRRMLADDGVDVRTGVAVERVGPTAAGVEVAAGAESWQGDALLVADGRAPNVRGCSSTAPDRARAGRHRRRPLPADQPATRLRLRRRAGRSAIHALRRSAGLSRACATRCCRAAPRRCATVPWTLFTDPEAAQVGLERAAGARTPQRRRARGTCSVERVDRALARGTGAGPSGRAAANGELCRRPRRRRAGQRSSSTSTCSPSARPADGLDLAGPIHVYLLFDGRRNSPRSARSRNFLAHPLRGRLLRRWVRRAVMPGRRRRGVARQKH